MDTPRADLTAYQALLFDLDGVITPTADLHRKAWAAMFQEYLGTQTDNPDAAAYTEQDYYTYLDGRRRDEGVAALLESRGITAEAALVEELGTKKNEDFLRLVESGVTPYEGSVALLDQLAEYAAANNNLPQLAIVSSSKNAVPVLKSAGLIDRFALIVDGAVAAEQNLPGKPAPDTYVYAAEQLGVTVAEAVVIEDAISGVASGKAGEFGLVVGVDRGTGRQALLDAGAQVVVDDLSELVKPR